MHVVVATDGSPQSLRAAQFLRSFTDRATISDVTVVAVVRPLASVGFADELSSVERRKADLNSGGFRKAAQSALEIVAAEFAEWGPEVHKQIRSGSPSTEIIKAAHELGAGLAVVASGGRGLSNTVLIGSTAQRVQHYAHCPVLVVRSTHRSHSAL